MQGSFVPGELQNFNVALMTRKVRMILTSETKAYLRPHVGHLATGTGLFILNSPLQPSDTQAISLIDSCSVSALMPNYFLRLLFFPLSTVFFFFCLSLSVSLLMNK